MGGQEVGALSTGRWPVSGQVHGQQADRLRDLDRVGHSLASEGYAYDPKDSGISGLSVNVCFAPSSRGLDAGKQGAAPRTAIEGIL